MQADLYTLVKAHTVSIWLEKVCCTLLFTK